VLLGIVLIPGSFIVLGIASCRERVSEALANAVQHAQAASAGQNAVYSTGTIQAPLLGDPGWIKPGHNLKISRSTQMYAWESYKKKEGNKEKNEKPVYDCRLTWTSSPNTSIQNKEGCKGKYNPAPSIADNQAAVPNLAIVDDKAYSVATEVSYYGLPSPDFTTGDFMQPITKDGSYFYPVAGCASSPYAGCMRLSYSGYSYDPSANYTVIGAFSGSGYGLYTSKRDNKYLAIGPGDYNSAMEAIKSSDARATLAWFIGAVIAITAGMSLIVGPLLTIIEQIPVIGGFGAGAIRVIFALIGIITMTIFYFLFRYWYVVLALFIIGVGVMLYLGYKKKQAAPA
jgi:hypothetical protein